MGSFDVTCAVSGLPATGRVRYMLLVQGPYYRPGQFAVDPHDVWAPLTPPMACDYYDYGRVRAFGLTLMRKAWRAQLRECLVPTPLGANEYHDPAVRRGSKLAQMMEAAHAGRLRVRQGDYGELAEARALRKEIEALRHRSAASAHLFESQSAPIEEKPARRGPPPEVPTWRRVERALRAAGVESVRIYPESYARVIVVATKYGESKHDDVTQAVEAAGFVATKRAHRNGAPATLVTPKDYRAAMADRAERLVAKRERLDISRPLAVVEAFIREDVWQSLLDVSGHRIEAHKQSIERSIRDLEGHPFCPSPADTVRHAKALISKDETLRAQWPEFLRACAELSVVRRTLASIDAVWSPTRYGGQVHEWKRHARLHEKWADIAMKEREREKKLCEDEGEEYDDEGEA